MPVISLDIPSGYDAATGIVRDPAIRATASLTLALPKPRLQSPEASEVIGKFYAVDISVPPKLYARPPLTLKVEPILTTSDITRIA